MDESGEGDGGMRVDESGEGAGLGSGSVYEGGPPSQPEAPNLRLRSDTVRQYYLPASV